MEKKLCFREDKSFKILQFTDIHFTHDDERDHQTVELLYKIIKEEMPDLIITTGDTVYGEQNVEYLPKVLAPFIESGIPWTWTFGNHDVEFAGSHEALFEEVLKLPGCVAFHDPASVDGVGNHVLKIVNDKGQTKWLVFAMDSGDYNPMKTVGGYGFITRNQIEWYKNQIKETEKEEKEFGALAFQHMAIPEFQELLPFERCYGIKRDGIGCPRINSGFFHAMLEAGHTRGLFVGHDHANDFYGKLYGITLGYGRASGYGGYGSKDHLKGARIFILNEKDTENFTTYVRLENGVVVDDPWRYEPLMKRDEG